MFLNMKLLAQHTLNGFGGMGEGMSMQLARDGRRVLWLAHESAPKNFTAVDVTEPRSPKVIVQTDLPHAQMRSNSLEVSGDLMAVAYQVSKFGLKPAGFELFDISAPEKPKSISFFDASGPHSRGCHQLWFVDGKTVHMACADPELKPRNPKDDQVYRIVDVANPSKPVAVGRWHLPGTMDGDDAPPPKRKASIRTHPSPAPALTRVQPPLRSSVSTAAFSGSEATVAASVAGAALSSVARTRVAGSASARRGNRSRSGRARRLMSFSGARTARPAARGP